MRKSRFLILFPEGTFSTVIFSARRQKSSLSFAARLDQVGMIASSFCALHCLLMPLVVGLLPLFGRSFLADEQTEWTLIGVALFVGLCSLIPGFWFHHRKLQPLLVFAIGVALILLVRLLLVEFRYLELFGVVTGGVLLASAHALNLRYCRQCCLSSSQA